MQPPRGRGSSGTHKAVGLILPSGGRVGGLAGRAFGTVGPTGAKAQEGGLHERSEGWWVNQLGHRREKVEDDSKVLGVKLKSVNCSFLSGSKSP